MRADLTAVCLVGSQADLSVVASVARKAAGLDGLLVEQTDAY